MVAPEVSAFTFDAALFVAAGRVAELALKAPVRPKSNEAAGLFALVAAEDPLYDALQVVITEKLEDAIKI